LSARHGAEVPITAWPRIGRTSLGRDRKGASAVLALCPDQQPAKKKVVVRVLPEAGGDWKDTSCWPPSRRKNEKKKKSKPI
jgi:hypothetical protein